MMFRRSLPPILAAALILASLTFWRVGANAGAGAAGSTDIRYDLAWGGMVRHYLLHVPAGVDLADGDSGHRLPLVMVLHGRDGEPGEFARQSGFDPVADRQGFVAVYPEGSSPGATAPMHRTWNAGFCCVPALRAQVDDVGFLNAVVDRIERDLPIDTSRIYVTGFSNGGMMAYRLAAESHGRFAAVAAISGAIGGRAGPGMPLVTWTPPAQPLPVLIVHGHADRVVLYDGGVSTITGFPGRFNMSVADALHFWTTADHCNARASEWRSSDISVIEDTYAGCHGGAEVELVQLVNERHAWPRSIALADGQASSGAEFIWRFFERHQHMPLMASAG